jgi:hypothetical protein
MTANRASMAFMMGLLGVAGVAGCEMSNPACAPCNSPVVLLLSTPGGTVDAADVTITATHSGGAALGVTCNPESQPVRCDIYSTDGLTDGLDGTYTITVDAVGFQSQTLDVVVEVDPSDDECSCGYLTKEVDVTLNP